MYEQKEQLAPLQDKEIKPIAKKKVSSDPINQHLKFIDQHLKFMNQHLKYNPKPLTLPLNNLPESFFDMPQPQFYQPPPIPPLKLLSIPPLPTPLIKTSYTPLKPFPLHTLLPPPEPIKIDFSFTLPQYHGATPLPAGSPDPLEHSLDISDLDDDLSAYPLPKISHDEFIEDLKLLKNFLYNKPSKKIDLQIDEINFSMTFSSPPDTLYCR